MTRQFLLKMRRQQQKISQNHGIQTLYLALQSVEGGTQGFFRAMMGALLCLYNFKETMMNSLQRTTVFCASLALAGLTTLAPAQAQYTIDYAIRPYQSNVYDSWFHGINNSGQTTGYTVIKNAGGQFVQNAVIYQNGNAQALAPRGTGLAINDRGDVAGRVAGSPTFFPSTGGQMPIVAPGFDGNTVKGLNNAGNVLVNGFSEDQPTVGERFGLWNTGGFTTLTALDALYPATPVDNGIGTGTYSSGITNLGSGDRFSAGVHRYTFDLQDPDNEDDDLFTDEFAYAYVFDGQSGYKMLQSSTPGDEIRPINFNADGSIFGWEGEDLAIWNEDGTLRSTLPTFAGGLLQSGYGGYSSVQRNNLGQIIAITSAKGIALYDPLTGMWSDVSASIAGLGTGTFDSIEGYNDLGQFVGLVRPPAGGGTFGFVATAVPEPGSLALLLGVGISGVGLVLRRRRK